MSKSSKGRSMMQGKLAYKRKGNGNWKKRGVVAFCGTVVTEKDTKAPSAQILLFEDYEKVEKPGQKPKNIIKLEEAKIESNYTNSATYSSTIASPHGGVRLSASPSGYSSGGSGSGMIGDSGSGTVTENHTFSITTKNGDTHEFRTDTENERLRWVKLLQLLIMYPRSTIPEEPKVNPIRETFRLRLEAKPYGANSVWPVYILPEEVGDKCGIIGTNVLALKSGIPGKQVGTLNIYNPADPTTPLVCWDRDKMRRTGKTGNLVFIEIGRRCFGGPGLVWMYSGFNDAQALRETLHNFLFKGDGNAVPIHTQTPALYDSPRASFDSNFPPSYQRENSIGSFTHSNPILSRSRSQDHDSGFVGSPGSFTSPKLEGPPVRLDKHPSIRRKRDSSHPRDIRRSSSTTSPMGSFSETSARSVESNFEDGSLSGQHSRSHSPQDECDEVVGSMDPVQEHNVPTYDVVSSQRQTSGFQQRFVVGGPLPEYETMIHPKSNMDAQGEYVQMGKAPLAQPSRSNPISVPQSQSYNTLQHFSNKQSPQNSSVARNSYDTLPTIREASKVSQPQESNYINHPLPQDLKDVPSEVYAPDYENVQLASQGRRSSMNDVNSGSGRRNSMRRRDSDRECVQLPVKSSGPSAVNGLDNYVMFQPRNIPASDYTQMHQHPADVQQRMVRGES